MTSRSGEPAGYRLIAASLRDQIITGELAPGQRLPSEADIAYLWGVAKETARRAMRLLRTEGLVVGERGRPATVRQIPEVIVVAVRKGAEVETRMPTLDEARALGIGEGVPVAIVSYLGEAEVYAGNRTRFRFT